MSDEPFQTRVVNPLGSSSRGDRSPATNRTLGTLPAGVISSSGVNIQGGGTRSIFASPTKAEKPARSASQNAETNIDSQAAASQSTRGAVPGENAGSIKFSGLDSNLYGCINTSHPNFEIKHAENTTGTSSFDVNTVYDLPMDTQQLIPDRKTPSSRSLVHVRNASSGSVRRLRSTLLELRSLTMLTDVHCRRQSKRFASSVVGYSQGILGSSAYSTCLSFRPPSFGSGTTNSPSFLSPPTAITRDYEREIKVQVATGLSSGALCIHSGDVNLYNTNTASLEGLKSDFSRSAAPCQLELNYYSTRHSKQATSIAWRPKDSRYVAVGLQSQRHKNRGEEFCCLVWDVEQQSGGAGGGSSVGGSSGGGLPSEKREPSIKGKH
jgi:hypothetical protein